MDLYAIVQPLLSSAAIILGGLLLRRLNTPTARDRAEHLAIIAGAAAALVRSKYPNATWTTVLEQTVNEIAAAAGLPTKNRGAIQRAAAAALAGLGLKPGN